MLFTVFNTDSVEKIKKYGSTRENLFSGRLKSAYSATETSYNIEKNRVASCVVFVLCLFLTVLWVCLASAIVVFSSHTHYCQLAKIKALIRLHGCTGCSVRSFFACN